MLQLGSYALDCGCRMAEVAAQRHLQRAVAALPQRLLPLARLLCCPNQARLVMHVLHPCMDPLVLAAGTDHACAHHCCTGLLLLLRRVVACR
jgi:hypothetical protein